MDRTFWLERWQRGEIGFHTPNVQPPLVKFWPRLDVAKGAMVFVPLAGKSVDMVWLAEQGYRVVGVELSELAIEEFFKALNVRPSVRQVGKFSVTWSGAIELWRGDFFDLSASELPPLDAAYDRAAFVAMPDDMQRRYANKLAELMPAGAPVLLIGLDYDPREMKGPPFPIPHSDVESLLGGNFSIDVLDSRDGLAKSEHLKKRGVTRLEEVTYLLRRKA